MLVAPMVGSDSLTVTDLIPTGETVEEGDVVVQFDTTQQEYNLREAEADLAEAQQKVIQAEADSQASDEETRYGVTAAEDQVKLAELEVRRNPFLAAPGPWFCCEITRTASIDRAISPLRSSLPSSTTMTSNGR